MCCEHMLNGEVPYKAVNTETGEKKWFMFLGEYSQDKLKAGQLQPGFYAVWATGSYYVLFDGKDTWRPWDKKYTFEYITQYKPLNDVHQFLEI